MRLSVRDLRGGHNLFLQTIVSLFLLPSGFPFTLASSTMSPRPSNTTHTCNSASNASSSLSSFFSSNDEWRQQQPVSSAHHHHLHQGGALVHENATNTILSATLLNYYAQSSDVVTSKTYRSIGVQISRAEKNRMLIAILDEAIRISSLDDLLVNAAPAKQEANQSSSSLSGLKSYKKQ